MRSGCSLLPRGFPVSFSLRGRTLTAVPSSNPLPQILPSSPNPSTSNPPVPILFPKSFQVPQILPQTPLPQIPQFQPSSPAPVSPSASSLLLRLNTLFSTTQPALASPSALLWLERVYRKLLPPPLLLPLPSSPPPLPPLPLSPLPPAGALQGISCPTMSSAPVAERVKTSCIVGGRAGGRGGVCRGMGKGGWSDSPAGGEGIPTTPSSRVGGRGMMGMPQLKAAVAPKPQTLCGSTPASSAPLSHPAHLHRGVLLPPPSPHPQCTCPPLALHPPSPTSYSSGDAPKKSSSLDRNASTRAVLRMEEEEVQCGLPYSADCSACKGNRCSSGKPLVQNLMLTHLDT